MLAPRPSATFALFRRVTTAREKQHLMCAGTRCTGAPVKQLAQHRGFLAQEEVERLQQKERRAAEREQRRLEQVCAPSP